MDEKGRAETVKEFVEMVFWNPEGTKLIQSIYNEDMDYTDIITPKLEKRIRKIIGKGV